jgi:hypothetical protein
MRTIFPQEIEDSGVTDTALTQETAESESAKVKFPKRIKHRGRQGKAAANVGLKVKPRSALPTNLTPGRHKSSLCGGWWS